MFPLSSSVDSEILSEEMCACSSGVNRQRCPSCSHSAQVDSRGWPKGSQSRSPIPAHLALPPPHRVLPSFPTPKLLAPDDALAERGCFGCEGEARWSGPAERVGRGLDRRRDGWTRGESCCCDIGLQRASAPSRPCSKSEANRRGTYGVMALFRPRLAKTASNRVSILCV